MVNSCVKLLHWGQNNLMMRNKQFLCSENKIINVKQDIPMFD